MPTDYKKALALLAAEKEQEQNAQYYGKIKRIWSMIASKRCDRPKNASRITRIYYCPKTEKLQEQGGDAWTVVFLSATVVAL